MLMPGKLFASLIWAAFPAAGAIGAGATTNQIRAGLASEGFSITSFETYPNRIEISARRGDTQVERYYRLDGTIEKEEPSLGGIVTERYFDANGNVTRTDT